MPKRYKQNRLFHTPSGLRITPTRRKGRGDKCKGVYLMKNTIDVVKIIEAITAQMPFEAKVKAVSISLNREGAIVTLERDRLACKIPAVDFITYEWNINNAGALFWGHYDMSEEEAAIDHAQRFARLTGGAI